MWGIGNNKELRKLILQTEKYAHGDITEGINFEDYTGEIRILVGHIANMAELLSQSNRQMQVASGKVLGAVNQVNNAISEANMLAENIRQEGALAKKLTTGVAAAAEQASQQVEAVIAATKTITAIASDIYQDSVNTKQAAEEGCMAVAEAACVMMEIGRTSHAADERIRFLTQTAREINNFLSTIHGISVQTNLLALNAAIEAARAGEHGRGFAVVAQEIQKLSDASTEAASSANKLLTQIDGGVSQVSSAVAAGVNAVESGKAAVQSAESRLRSILEASAQVERKLSGASLARAAQYDATQQTANFLAVMAGQCQESASHVSAVTDSIAAQEIHLRETGRMGEILDNVAKQLVYASGSATFSAALSDSKKAALERIINEVKSLLANAAGTEAIVSMRAEEHEPVLDAILRRHSQLEALWTNAANGCFIVSLPPAGIANAGAREWFQVASSGDIYVSPIYISAISSCPCITVSMPIKAEGNAIGVIGADLKLGLI